MRKIPFYLSAAALTLGSVSLSEAQVAVKAGVNLASVAESAQLEEYNELKNKSVVGFQAGLAFDLAPSSVFSLQPELLFIQKGGKSLYQIDENNKFESRYYYNYVEVPVLAKIKFGAQGNGSGFYLLGGPYAGLAFSGKAKNTVTILGNTSTSEETFEFDNNDAEVRNRRLDWGVSFGGGLKFGRTFVDLRYNLGINNLLDSDADNQNDNRPYRRNRGVGLTIGYQF